MLEHLDSLAQASAKAISNIKFDKVVVWEGGNGAGAGSSTASFLQNMARTMPAPLTRGKRVDGTSGRWTDVYNPATGDKVRRVALGSGAEIDAAVKAAAAAFPGWAATPPLTRAPGKFCLIQRVASMKSTP